MNLRKFATVLAILALPAIVFTGCQKPSEKDIQKDIDELKAECSDPKTKEYKACAKIKYALNQMGMCDNVPTKEDLK